jgi:hypothetical protein
VDTFKIGERVVRVAGERIDTRWMEPSAGELHRIELFLLGLLLLFMVQVGIVGALLSWYWRRKRPALTCAALSLVCAGLAVSAFWGSRPAPPPYKFVMDGEPPITFVGGREENRRPFELQSTHYTATWWATLPPNEPSCRVHVAFQGATADRDVHLIFNMPLDRQKTTRAGVVTELIYGVEPGLHELLIIEDTGCEWSITLTPGWGTVGSPTVR